MKPGILIAVIIILIEMAIQPFASGKAIAPPSSNTDLELGLDLKCTVDLAFNINPRSGSSVPYYLDFTNRGKDRRIRVESRIFGIHITTLTVPGGTVSRHFIYIRTLNNRISYPTFRFYDDDTGEFLKMTTLNQSHSHKKNQVVILTVSAGPALSISSSIIRTKSHKIQFENVNPDLIPDRWIGLTGVDIVVIPYADWISPQMRIKTISEWIAMGGYCLIVDVPKEEKDLIIFNINEHAPYVEEDDHQKVSVGLGRLFFVTNRELAQSGLMKTPPSKIKIYDSKSSSIAPPIPSDIGQMPFLVSFLLLFAFCIIAGPISWWILVKKRKKPILYFIITPLFSISAILMLVVIDFSKQGFAPSVALRGIEFIDQKAQKRITLSQYSLYCPFLMNLAPKGDLNEQPHFINHPRDFFPNAMFVDTVSRADNVELVGDTLIAREIATYGREKITDERRRLEAWKEGDSICVENHLGSPLEKLTVCVDKQYAYFKKVAPGEKLNSKILSQEALTEYLEPLRRDVPFIHLYKILQNGMAMNTRLIRAMEEGRSCYTAFRTQQLDDMIWLDSADFLYDSRVIIWGIF